MTLGQADTTQLIASILGPILVIFAVFRLATYKKLIRDYREALQTGQSSFHRLPRRSQQMQFALMFLVGAGGLVVHHHSESFTAVLLTIVFAVCVAVGLIGLVYPGLLGNVFKNFGHMPEYDGTPWVSALFPWAIFLVMGIYLSIEGWLKNNPNLSIQ